MCGIAGFSGMFQKELLDKMNTIQFHRGPDDGDIFYSQKDAIGLAHRRLSILDLSPLGHQPMWDNLKNVVIVYNGELYNFKELRDNLIKKGFSFKSQCDTEVMIYLYLHYGIEMLSKLNGIFSFAIWDCRTKVLFCARDNLGVKPFYYCEMNKGFLFASEIKALLQCEDVPREIDPVAIHHYLTYLWCPAPNTMLKKVKKLKPGYALIIKEGKIQKEWQFYDIPYNNGINNISKNEAIEQCDQLLHEAINRQMVSDAPLGAFLSGGLDSTSIVALGRKYTPSRLQCFTIGFNDDAFKKESSIDDLPYAEMAAKSLDVDLHKIIVGHEIVSMLSKMVYYLDEPQADPAAIHTYMICKLARQKGMKVLLSGTGGDDIFSGYRRHLAVTFEKYWEMIPSSVGRLLKNVAANFPKKNTNLRRIAKVLEYADIKGDEKIISYFNWIDPKQLMSLYTQENREEIINSKLSQPLLMSIKNLNEKIPALNKMLYLEGKHFLADHNLNYTDKMSMATGVEVRVPLLDLNLIKFATSLPIRFKQNGNTGKWVFRKCMEKYIPHDIIYRKKTGFGAPVRHWIRGPLQPLCNELLSEQNINKRGFFNYDSINKLICKDMVGQIDASYTIFSLMCIELWCQNFIDKTIPIEPLEIYIRN
jgi:asparagine synthase (glutamine-hydrolysing)